MSDKGQTHETFEAAIGRERQHPLYCKACPGPCRGHEANVVATDAAHQRELAEAEVKSYKAGFMAAGEQMKCRRCVGDMETLTGAESRGVRKGRAEAFREEVARLIDTDAAAVQPITVASGVAFLRAYLEQRAAEEEGK